MTMQFWSFFTLGAIIVAISLFRIVPPLAQPGYFTEFGEGYMIGNALLFLSGLFLMIVAWRKRKSD
jgi:hypothetical protein